MKKWMIILISSLLLAGCTNEEDLVKTENGYTIEAQVDYKDDTEMIEQLEALEKVIGKTDSTETNRFQGTLEVNVSHWFNEKIIPERTEAYRVNNENENLGNMKGGAYLFSCKLGRKYKIDDLLDYSVLKFIDRNLTPGLMDYLQMQAETSKDLSPQATVINNCVVMYTPIYLYEGYSGNSYSYEGNGPFNIYFYPYQLTNAYHKQLVEAVDPSRFVILPPVTGEEASYLQLSTPFFLENRSATTVSEDGAQYTYSGENRVSYGIYTKDETIQKIRTTIKLINAHNIDKAYFDALRSWGKTELGLGQEELGKLEELIECCSKGEIGNKSGKLGEYTYTYRVMKDDSNSEEEEKLIEFVIEKK